MLYTGLTRPYLDNKSEYKNINIMSITKENKQTINKLKSFYIDHMIEMYNNDWDKFWEEHEDLIKMETELELN
jgi:hypothetical protein